MMLPTRAARRGLAAIACVALATAAPAAPVRSDAPPLGACSIRPSADTMPFDWWFLETWRLRDGVSEILHDVRCSDGRFDRVWIAADFI